MEYISLAIGLLLIIFGLWGVLTQKNILKIIIGFSIFDTGLHVVMVSIAYVKGGTAPIIDGTVNIAEAASRIVDPIPQALVLTAIVIGLGVTSLMLAFAMKLHKQKGSLNIEGFKDLKG